jgi:hypothetical protein
MGIMGATVLLDGSAVFQDTSFMELPWTELRVAAIGLGVSCLAALVVSFIGFAAAARRRTLGSGVATFTGNLFLVTVLAVTLPFVVALLFGPEGFFSSVAGWASVIAAAGLGAWLGWRIALVVGAFGITGHAIAGIHGDPHEPGPDPAAPRADPAAPVGAGPFAQADPDSPSVIAGKWNMVEFQASTGRVDEAAALVESLVRTGGGGPERLRSLLASGRVPALADHPRVRALLDGP